MKARSGARPGLLVAGVLSLPLFAQGWELSKVQLLLAPAGEQPAPGSIYALASERVSLFCAAEGRDGRVWDARRDGPLAIRWFLLEARLRRERLPGHDPEFPEERLFTNAHFPWCRKNRGWIGLDRLEYDRREIEAGRDQSSLDARLARRARAGDPLDGCGVARFQVEVSHRGRIVRTPGLDRQDAYGLSDTVPKLITLREDSFRGWLTSFLGVPGLHGSVPTQVERHLGVDCADLIVGALRRWGPSDTPYGNVGQLRTLLDPVLKGPARRTEEGLELGSGAARRLLRWGEEGVRPGDVVLVDYPPLGSWDHTVVLYEDANRNGRVDDPDLIFHAGPEEPHLSSLKEETIASRTSAYVLDIRRVPLAGGLPERWQRLERMIRDQAGDASTRLLLFRYLHRRLREAAPASSPAVSLAAPLADAAGRAVGTSEPSSYALEGYDFFQGNRHGGHPALDLFIPDRDQDGREDKTGRPVDVRSVSPGLVVSTCNAWASGSPLRGGRYVWVYDRASDAYWYYAHLDRVTVKTGDAVRPGSPLGTLGRTGANAHPSRSPTHLHLSKFVYRDGTLVSERPTWPPQ